MAFRREAGLLLPNERTDSRVDGIQALAASYPWVDAVDMKMFLAGFDAGDEFRIRNPESERSQSEPVETSENSK